MPKFTDANGDDTHKAGPYEQKIPLYEQLKRSKEKKELEWKQEMDRANSSYKLSDKEFQYYKELESERANKRRLEKMQEEVELQAFKKKPKQEQTVKADLDIDDLLEQGVFKMPKKPAKVTIKSNKEPSPYSSALNTEGGIDLGYSSESSDE